MDRPTDIFGTNLEVGQRIGCAFSYSQASVGYIRLGEIAEMGEDYIKVRWEADNRVSPKMVYGKPNRWIVL